MTIQADHNKKENFKLAADFLMTICPPPKAQNTTPHHRVSAVRAKGGKKGKICTGPRTGVEIRYYKRNEWNSLSEEQQKEVREHRQQHLKRKAEEESKVGHPNKIAALESMIEEQNQKIAALSSIKTTPPLPPKPSGNPLRPPTGFTQRE